MNKTFCELIERQQLSFQLPPNGLIVYVLQNRFLELLKFIKLIWNGLFVVLGVLSKKTSMITLFKYFIEIKLLSFFTCTASNPFRETTLLA